MEARVGIVSWQTAGLLDRCLAALPDALGSVDANVVVVDNASSDGSADVARRHGATVIVNERNIGYPRAMNQALAGADVPYLIALNPDTEATPGSLERLVARLDQQPHLGLVVPRLINTDGSTQDSVHRFPSVTLALVMGLVPFALRKGLIGRRYWLHGYADMSRRRRIDWATGAVHVMRRAALGDPEHAYPERLFMYGEDLALCWTLHRTGWLVELEPRAEVIHVGSAAAIQAFGNTIDERRLEADFDWYCWAHGTPQARLWAAANVIGYGTKLGVARVIWPAGDARTARTRHFLGLHVRHLRSIGRSA